MDKETCHKTLKYEFTADEKKKLASEMAEATQAEIDLVGEKEEVVASFKARIKEAEQKRKTASKKYRDGYEYRRTQCEIMRDFTAGMVTYVRMDTGEIAETRSMTADERQKELEGVQ